MNVGPDKNISDRIHTLIDKAKEEEVKDALETRDDWKRGTYAFEIISNITSVSSLILASAASVFSDHMIYLTYAATVSQAISVSCKGMAAWCSKKYTAQATIVNSITESAKTGKYPTISLLPSADRHSRTEAGEEKI